MANLLEETLEAISESGHVEGDVLYVTSSKASCDFETFKSLANFTYDASYGSAEVTSSLAIVFSDGTWLSRGEYDGSEWWQFESCPKKVEGVLAKLTESWHERRGSDDE